ncbi:pimeloyl-ACP methyl ester carboxylesterase [Bacillus mesophilus]|uniref:Alpha/beta hydrolase n=1 Tax=Bacillus mesophilus TaxID=1808955 RepID=A0A6M0QBF8_9BACI|nr:alpha/beta hydrolase [Bacillus mesophilus]MBM7663022.1 pimeloyl-ACP methyl ester carboxylesterase [Bacillus mesophilus]NEY73656.1 alpha/beta hydrolase [Bacillus mesophilus]
MKEIEVTIASVVTLRGTMAIPDGENQKLPAVIIIPGSGKLDRNGKVNKKMDLQVYRQLAHFISKLGFITLRYDKRGVGESEGDFFETGMWDLVNDAKEGINFLKKCPEVDAEKIIVLGHSEGAMIATAIAVREPIGGLILLSGAVERLEEALMRQRELVTKDILAAKGFLGWLLRLLGTHKKVEKQAQKFLGKLMDSKEDVIKVQFQKINAKWFREHFAYNVREDLGKIDTRTLAITGERDIQANPDVISRLSNYVKGESDYYVIPNMGHSLKMQEATSTMFTVKKDLIKESGQPLHPELEITLQKWLEKYYLEG